MTLFWILAVGTSLLLYVLLDGFDLGVGILYAFTKNDESRHHMLSSISPVWDGNETWLVIAGTTLFGAFPRAYAAILSAFYLPVIFMVGGLILRGVAFEFRYKATVTRAFWDGAFGMGSVFATFFQGLMIGALVQGIPLKDGQYIGGMLGWATPFSIACGLALCVGYALLGAGWLVAKCEGEIRDVGYRILPWLVCGVLGALVVVFFYALGARLDILHRWTERPWLFACPALGLLAFAGLFHGVRRRSDSQPFLMAATLFVAAFATFLVSFWPYMIPFSMTIEQAASPPSSLWFMFWGAGFFAFPLTLTYTAFVYRIFRGKIVLADHH